jgi:hypothetical protein
MKSKPRPRPKGSQPPRDHPGPWGSVLWDHLEAIRDLRRKRKRWSDIAVHLEKEHGVKITSRAIRNFFARAIKAKLPLGFEPTSLLPKASPTPAPPASAPSPQIPDEVAAEFDRRAKALREQNAKRPGFKIAKDL